MPSSEGSKDDLKYNNIKVHLGGPLSLLGLLPEHGDEELLIGMWGDPIVVTHLASVMLCP